MRFEGLLSLLVPRTCIGCGRAIGAVPPQRTSPPERANPRSHRLAERFCAACEAALALDPAIARRVGRVPWPVYTALPYRGQGEAWLRRIKYPKPGLTGLDGEARGLLQAIANDLATALPPVDLIVPVPLHRDAYLRREFNPALLWARALARATGSSIHPRLLTKRRDTRPQKGLSIADRRANVEAAFAIDHRVARRIDPGSTIAIVDDVVTTGATLEACIRPVQAAGVCGRGVGVCVARTPRFSDDRSG